MQPQLDKNIPDRCLEDIFCEQFKCPKEKYSERLFWMCIRPNVRWIAKICWIFHQRMFAGDLEMLRQLGRTHNTRELRYELESFRHYHPPRGFLRRDLKVRVSGRRLLKIASRLFGVEAARKARSLPISSRETTISNFEQNQNVSSPSPDTGFLEKTQINSSTSTSNQQES